MIVENAKPFPISDIRGQESSDNMSEEQVPVSSAEGADEALRGKLSELEH